MKGARPSLLRQSAEVLRKDSLLEWRTRTRLNALLFFALATMFLFSFAVGPDSQALRHNAGAYLWLAIVFASVLALSESFRVEQENASLDGLRLAPVDARAIFLGKALGNAALLLFLSAVVTPVMAALYSTHLGLSFWHLAFVLVLGCMAISAPGTLYAAIASFARARDVLLPVLLFPLLIPALLSSVKATALTLEGDPMNQFNSWAALLGSFNLLYWGLGFALFPRVVED